MQTSCSDPSRSRSARDWAGAIVTRAIPTTVAKMTTRSMSFSTMETSGFDGSSASSFCGSSASVGAAASACAAGTGGGVLNAARTVS